MLRRSFTLIELVVVIVITGMLAAGIGMFSQTMVVDSANLISVRGELTDEALHALNFLSREVRMIREVSDITTASASSLRFTSYDGLDVTYSLDAGGTRFMRNDDELCGDVSALAFSYEDADGNTTWDGDEVWLIRVRLQLIKGQEQKDTGLVVHPRSFKR